MPNMTTQLVAVHHRETGPEDLILLQCDFEQDGDQWVAECLQLGTAAYASTLEKVREELGAAILLQLNQVQRLGYMEEYLKEHRVQVRRLTPPKSAQSGSSWVEPTLVTAQGDHQLQVGD